jgi:hypothetical protein
MRQKSTTPDSPSGRLVKSIRRATRKQYSAEERSGLCWTAYAASRVLPSCPGIREITRRIIKSAISVFEQFNDIRNNRSFAHDNDLIDQAEARFIFDAISAFLRFLKSVEATRFGS